MIVSGLISELRREYADLSERHRDVRQGDGQSTVYKLKYSPVVEGSFKLYVNNALQSTSGYTLDYDTGDLDLQGPSSSEIRAQYKSVIHNDQAWLEFIQSSIRELGDKFYRSTIRSTSAMAISADVQVYSCPSNCIRVTEILESNNHTSAGTYVPVGTNVRYDRRANKIILGNPPTRANYVELSYLRKLAIPTATSSTLDLEDDWLAGIKIKTGAKHNRAYANKLAKDGNVSVEEGHLQVGQLRQLANDGDILFEDWKKRNKPVMPATTIPYHQPDGGLV